MNTHDHTDPHHVCMWEGPEYQESTLSTINKSLKQENQNHVDEIHRLRTLLIDNNIIWSKPPNPTLMETIPRQTSILHCTRGESLKTKPNPIKDLPHLPNELVLRILSLVVTSSGPIIDPFWKQRPENITIDEKSQSSISVAFLGTCKALNSEGIRLIFANNDFVFTQVAALENLSKFPLELRLTIKHLNVRVIGRYYDDYSYKKTLATHACYHDSVPFLTLHISARPKGIISDRGIQSYCWQQVTDFLHALVIPDTAHNNYFKLLPYVLTMQLDLVNFCEHLPFAGSSFLSVIRWQMGKTLEELVVTGAPEEDWGNGEERFLAGLVKDEGVMAAGCPLFVSKKNFLEPLPGYGLNLHVVRPRPPPDRLSFHAVKDILLKPAVTHPEGGKPPRSNYPLGSTIWKYTSDSLAEPQKKWIEFHSRCGYPVEECGELDLQSDVEDDEDEDEDEDENEDEEDDEEVEQWEDDGDDDVD